LHTIIYSGVADSSIFSLKELIGSALPAVEDDELDVTLKDEPKQPEKLPGKLPESADNEIFSPTENPGLSLMTKLIFFGVIIGAVLGFLRTRKGSMQEKSLA